MRMVAKALTCLFLFLAIAAFATNGTVKRNVNLRSDPSNGSPAITLLRPPDVIELIDIDASNGYYHVRTEDGQEGWIWGNLRAADRIYTAIHSR
jgi:uncharacterized protein YgiM (DUF1202 family)